MSKDYYKILGVSKNSSSEEIKKAYRRLALQYHPDRGGDQAKFKELNEAYQVISNPQKKAQYDQFGQTDFNSGNNSSGFDSSSYRYSNSGNWDDAFGKGFGFNFGGGLGDIFEDLFSQSFSQVQAELPISVSQAILGDKISFKTHDNETIELEIPAGIQDGQSFIIKGKGKSYKRGKGDLIISIKIKIPERVSPEEKELYEKIRQIEKEKKSWRFWRQ